MSVARPEQAHRIDAVFKALADPTRRAILDELRKAPRINRELCALFEMTRFGIMKHLGVLEEAGLIVVQRRGRERRNHLNPAPIRDICRRWMRPFEEPDSDRMLRLKQVVERAPIPRPMKRRKS